MAAIEVKVPDIGDFKDVPVIELSTGLATIKMPGHGRSGHSHAEGQVPHAWLDPILVTAYVDRIRDALSQADPANAALHADRSKAYRATLEELDAGIRTEVETIPAARRKIVTFHNAFQYFAKRYGLAVKGFVVASPGKEPSAKSVAELTRRIQQEQIPAVFAEAAIPMSTRSNARQLRNSAQPRNRSQAPAFRWSN